MKVLLLTLRNLHLPYLLPLYRAALELGREWDVAFTAPPYRPCLESGAGQGIEPTEKDRLTREGLLWVDWVEAVSFNPQVMVMCDPYFEYPVNQVPALRVNINHGLISKGLYYTRQPIVEREKKFHLIAVPGPFHKLRLQSIVDRPIVVSGLVKFDPVFQGLLTREGVRRRCGVDGDEPVILYAPTYNPQLSSVPVVLDQVMEWARLGWRVWVKLHPMSPLEWFSLYRIVAQLDERITLWEGIDLTPALVGCDVVVSDTSSAFAEAAVLDKPVVLVNNPMRCEYPYFNPDDVEYIFRDAGEEVDDPEDIVPAIERALNDPQSKAMERARLAEALGGPRDGRAALRILSAIRLLYLKMTHPAKEIGHSAHPLYNGAPPLERVEPLPDSVSQNGI